jgi:hypothetical protein
MPQKPESDETLDEYMGECTTELRAEGLSFEEVTDRCYSVWLKYRGEENEN